MKIFVLLLPTLVLFACSEGKPVNEEPPSNSKLETIAAQTTLPKGTVASNGGLNFRNNLVRENLSGVTWKHDFEASLLPGRVTIETDPQRVRTGNSSIRMHVNPKDCGWTVHRDDGGWNDCLQGNERVEIQTTDPLSGKQFYALSIMLDSNFSKHGGQPSTMHSDINLFQWYQLDSGACFNLQYNTRTKSLNIDIRCPNGVYDHQMQRVELSGPVFDRWHELVVFANWRSDEKGEFRVLFNGQLVMNYNGPTLSTKGRKEVNEAAFIYRYGSKDEPSWQFYTTPSTVWFDDIIRARSLSTIENRYSFNRSKLGF